MSTQVSGSLANPVGDKVPDDVITNAPGIAPASSNEEPREVFIGCSPAGFVQVILGKLAFAVEDAISGLLDVGEPNLATHWGVIVGDYVHELSADGVLSPIKYVNRRLEKIDSNPGHRDKYRLYLVGTTRLNDAAIAKVGVEVIGGMPSQYNPVANNCHVFADGLLERICDPGYKTVKMIVNRRAKQAVEETTI